MVKDNLTLSSPDKETCDFWINHCKQCIKISSYLLFNEKIVLHITRPVRWDSDHVIHFDDETNEIVKEIVHNDVLDRVFIATDYFNASINRISAWVTGLRSFRTRIILLNL